MKNESETEGSGSLSDAERLQLLEKSGKLNRLILFALAGVVVLLLIGFIAVEVSSLLRDDPSKAEAEQISQLEKQLHGMQDEITVLQDRLQKQEAQLALQQAGKLTGILKPSEDPGTVGQLSKTLLGQEKDFQQVMLTLQVGMRDLAYMLPGSRTWLDYYTEALNKSVATSKARAVEIQQWASGQPAPAVPVPKSN